MSFRCSLVGLPNVGKSTIFNLLVGESVAEVGNYPFCTIDPNTANVAVPDSRLNKLAEMVNCNNIVPAMIEFMDVAGLIAGASKGEGLGNKFLDNIRHTDVIVMVVRCFEDEDVTHVDGHIDPIRDIQTILNELILADLQFLEKLESTLTKKAKSSNEARDTLELIQKLIPILSDSQLVNKYSCQNEVEEEILQNLRLLTSKKIIYVCNVNEDALDGNEYTKKVEEFISIPSSESKILYISAKLEEEISQLSNEEKEEFLSEIGETGLNKVIFAGYQALNLISYFTAGPKETRAWSIYKGFTAPRAAGKIHTDFEKGFIRAETISYKDYVQYNGEVGAKENGKMRSEGKEYIVQDGDVIHFLFNN